MQNPSFEAAGAGQTFPGVVGAVAGWTFTTSGGGPIIIYKTGGPYLDDGEVVPDGNNALVIQGAGACSQVQSGLTVGKSYRLTLYATSRHFGEATALVTIDGQTACNAPVPIAGRRPWNFITYDFVAGATNVTLSIGNTSGATYFVDEVRVYAPTPVVPSFVTQPAPAMANRYAGVSLTLTAAVAD